MKFFLLNAVLIILTLAIFSKIELLSFLQGRETMWDFDVYHQTAVDVSKGADPYQLLYMQTAGPPAVIIPYVPLALFPLPLARSVIISLNLVAALASCWLLAKKTFASHRWSWTLLLYFFFWLTFLPRYNLNVGQPNIILMWLVTLALTTKTETVKGVSLGLVTLIKTHYVFALLSLIRHQHRALLTAGLTLVTLIILALPILKIEFYTGYLTHRLGSYVTTAAPIANLDYYNQSLRSTLSRLKVEELYPVIVILLLLVGSWQVIKSGDTAQGILLSLLISPIVWQHYLVVVYPIVVLTWRDYWQTGSIPWHLTFGSGLLLMHLPWLHDQPVALVSGIFASHFFLALLLIWISRFLLLKSAEL